MAWCLLKFWRFGGAKKPAADISGLEYVNAAGRYLEFGTYVAPNKYS